MGACLLCISSVWFVFMWVCLYLLVELFCCLYLLVWVVVCTWFVFNYLFTLLTTIGWMFYCSVFCVVCLLLFTLLVCWLVGFFGDLSFCLLVCVFCESCFLVVGWTVAGLDCMSCWFGFGFLGCLAWQLRVLFIVLLGIWFCFNLIVYCSTLRIFSFCF